MKPETPEAVKWIDKVEEKVTRTGSVIKPGDL